MTSTVKEMINMLHQNSVTFAESGDTNRMQACMAAAAALKLGNYDTLEDSITWF